MKDLSNWWSKCNTKLTEDQRRTIFNDYWLLGIYDRRLAFVSDHISVEDKATRSVRHTTPKKQKYRMVTYNNYYLPANGKMTCLYGLLSQSTRS